MYIHCFLNMPPLLLFYTAPVPSTASSTDVVRRVHGQSIQQATKIRPEISQLITKEVKSPTKPAVSEKKEEKPSLHIWDFAGHELYYTTHQVMGALNVPDIDFYASANEVAGGIMFSGRPSVRPSVRPDLLVSISQEP